MLLYFVVSKMTPTDRPGIKKHNTLEQQDETEEEGRKIGRGRQRRRRKRQRCDMR